MLVQWVAAACSCVWLLVRDRGFDRWYVWLPVSARVCGCLHLGVVVCSCVGLLVRARACACV